FLTNLNKKILFNKKETSLLLLLVFMFIYTIVLDLYQIGEKEFKINSLFSIRIISMIFLSFLPAYLIYKFYLKSNHYLFDTLFKWSLYIQLVFFIIMFLSPDLKIALYNTFALGKVNLYDHNLTVRGFGLSSEINFMTPSLLIYMTFILIEKRILLKLIVVITQVINSNMAIISFICAVLFLGRSKFIFKIFIFILLSSIIMIFNDSLLETLKNFMPRFYYEFIGSNGTRTASILMNTNIFEGRYIDIFTFLFGYQENVASNVGVATITHDSGWIIMFFYGGVVFILLFLLFVFLLSILIFENKLYALLWFNLALIFNSKGMILGMNGYFFLSFLFLFSKRFNKLK
ncbi:hypothetical protein, partial [Glaesserella parasuis]